MAIQHINPTGVAATDTAALQAALATGAPIVLGHGSFLLQGSGTEILRLATSAPFVGAGAGATRLVVKSTVPNTTDIIRVTPSVGDPYRRVGGAYVQDSPGLVVGGFTIAAETEGQRYGQHGLHIDLTDAPEQALCNSTFEDIVVRRINGRGVRLTNPDLNDGFYANTFRNVYVVDGMLFERLGDSIVFDSCRCSNDWWYPATQTAKIGIEIASMVLGANIVKIRDCNITACGGAIKATGIRCYIDGCNIELPYIAGIAPAAAVELLAGEGTDYELHTIRNTTVRAESGTGAHALKITSGENITIGSGTRLNALSASAADLYIAAGVTGTVVEKNALRVNGKTTDLGTGTVFQ